MWLYKMKQASMLNSVITSFSTEFKILTIEIFRHHNLIAHKLYNQVKHYNFSKHFIEISGK